MRCGSSCVDKFNPYDWLVSCVLWLNAGMYSSISPSLSARLTNGVVDVGKRIEEDDLPAATIPLRRHELFISPWVIIFYSLISVVFYKRHSTPTSEAFTSSSHQATWNGVWANFDQHLRQDAPVSYERPTRVFQLYYIKRLAFSCWLLLT